MPWFYAVAEGDHPIQNPTGAGKLLRLGQHLRLTSESRVLDLACGRGGPALILAESFGCRVLGVERAPEFVAANVETLDLLGSEIEDGREVFYEVVHRGEAVSRGPFDPDSVRPGQSGV